MDFSYKQIGLNLDDDPNGYRVSVYFIINRILNSLRDYTDNGPIDAEGRFSLGVMNNSGRGHDVDEILEILAKNKIVQYETNDKNTGSSYSVFVINRYKLELLRAEMKWLADEIDGIYENHVPQVDNLVYYDVKSGRGFVNGNKIYLKGRNKKLFNMLFATAPNPVDKKLLEGIARLGHKSDDLKYAMNDSFSLVRKACKVDKNVIFQRNDTGCLNAKVFPLSAQLFQGFEKGKSHPKKIRKMPAKYSTEVKSRKRARPPLSS